MEDLSLHELLRQINDLFQEISTNISDIAMEMGMKNEYSIKGYNDLPFSAFEAKEPTFPLPDMDQDIFYNNYGLLDEDGGEEPEIKPTVHRFTPYYGNVIIRRVPRYQLGYRVLGRAFPYMGLVEIAADLYGQDFEEVKMHELNHMKHPELNEAVIRRMTKDMLPFQARFH